MDKIKIVFLSGLWIGLNEFIRNELLLKSFWTDHYQELGLDFPDSPVNGFVWMVWSFLFAGLILLIRQKFSTQQTIAIAWVAGFIMMWLVVANLSVLPISILLIAIPWSLIETGGAVVIINRGIKNS